MDDVNDAAGMAKLVKQQARRVEREAHTLRQMAARLERMAAETSEEETDHGEDPRSSAHLQAV